MASFKPSDDTDVMPLVLRLLQVIGVWDVQRCRYRYVAVFLFYVFGILIPKLCFGYPTLETAIAGYTELILETNVFAGMLLFYQRYDHFVPLVDELRAFAAIVFQDNQPMFLRTNLTDLNLRIHKYTLCYCLYMCFCCTVYCVAPLGSNIAGYTAAMADTASNSSSSTTFAFTLYLEQGFYWLDNRTSLLGYCVCTVFMFPLMYLCAYTATVKVVAVFNMIKYCQTVLRIVVLKLRLLKTLPDVRQRSDGMSEVWVLHQRALRCAELLELVLQPLLLMQFVLCILIWCMMLLYFTVSGINVKFINMFLLFLFVSIETFGYCYLGTQLSQESINIGQALYASGWYEYDVQMRKHISFMIMRSQRRVGLTAAKFCFVDMEQFGAMLNMSYSFFVVLKDAF
uniref:Odorant receptor n=1 Tax=Anopheles coluzzii TaxID=1518534 RepID=A0A6E8VXU4_ANOCL